MPTWNELAARYAPATVRGLISFFDKINGPPDAGGHPMTDHASLAGALVARMRTTGWRYTTSALRLLPAVNAKQIVCDELAWLLMCLYAYKNHPANVVCSVEDVHRQNDPVFLPSVKFRHTGLQIALNVSGPVPGLFFSAGHRVASLGGVCYDLISGHRGPKASMDLAYLRCTNRRRVPDVVFQLDYMGGSILLTGTGSWTAEGLAKYASSYGR